VLVGVVTASTLASTYEDAPHVFVILELGESLERIRRGERINGPPAARVAQVDDVRVVGNTRNVLVPVLSLLEIPRLARLCTAFRFTLIRKRLPRTWSKFARIDCF